MSKSIEEMISEKKKKASTPNYGASNLFTDREEPQESFERKLAVMNEYRKEISLVQNFYGIGGIGKTSFKNRLVHLLDGDKSIPRRYFFENDDISTYHLTIDFEHSEFRTDKIILLKAFRNQILLQIPKACFYYFDTAMILYLKKLGLNIDEDKAAASFLNDNQWLGAIVNGLGVLPVIGWSSNLIQAIDNAYGAISQMRTKWDERGDQLITQLVGMESDEIEKIIHQFFIFDMNKNIENDIIDRPLVVFMDTYEKYVDTLNSDTLKITNDYWLRKDEDCLIKSINGVFWVIFGREKLDWTDDITYWGEFKEEQPFKTMTEEDKKDLSMQIIEFHLLGDLSCKDSVSYLEKAGVDNVTLRNQIFELTKGTPLFLDICVRQYYSVIKEREPQISDFGNSLDELVSRYIQNMPDHYQKMSFFLAVLGHWTDELALEIGPHVFDEFSEYRYYDYINHSFVISDDDGKRYFHEVVGAACLEKQKRTDKLIGQKTKQVAAEWYKKIIESGCSIYDLDRYLKRYIEYAINEYIEPNALHETSTYCINMIEKKILAVDVMASYETSILLLKYLLKYHSSTNTLCNAGLILALCLSEIGLHGDEVIELLQDIYTMCTNSGDEKNMSAVKILSSMCREYMAISDYSKALEMAKKAYDIAATLLEPNSTILSGLKSLIGDINKLWSVDMDYAKELALSKSVYLEYANKYGEKTEEAISKLKDVCKCYIKIEDYISAKEIAKKIHDFYSNEMDSDFEKSLDASKLLGDCYGLLGDNEKKYEIYTHIYEICKDKYGEHALSTVDALVDMGRCLFWSERYQESIEIYLACLDYIGEGIDFSLKLLNYIYDSFHKMNDLESSLYILKSIHNFLNQNMVTSFYYFENLIKIADLYIEMDDHKNAYDYLLLSYEWSEKCFGEDSDHTKSVLKSLHKEKELIEQMGDGEFDDV